MRFRYLIWLMAVIGLIILLIILLIPSAKPKTLTPKDLLAYASTDAVARLTIDGPETAQSTHQSVQITAGQQTVTYQQINGYDNQVANTQTFTNNQAAYDVFLHALAHAGFTLGNTNPNLSDEKGYCPTGNRFIFELIDGTGSDLQRYWSTSCGNPKTYNGNLDLTLTLFKSQVPNYFELTSKVNL